MVTSAEAASVNMAAPQPQALMTSCVTGANTNCPSEPPALMVPAAIERCDALRCRERPADEDREAAGPGTGGAEHAEREQQPHLGSGECREREARGQQQRAEREHTERAELVRQRAEHWLGGAPHELADREREAQGGDADTGGLDDGPHEQARDLPRSRRHQQNGGRRQDERQRALQWAKQNRWRAWS